MSKISCFMLIKMQILVEFIKQVILVLDLEKNPLSLAEIINHGLSRIIEHENRLVMETATKLHSYMLAHKNKFQEILLRTILIYLLFWLNQKYTYLFIYLVNSEIRSMLLNLLLTKVVQGKLADKHQRVAFKKE